LLELGDQAHKAAGDGIGDLGGSVWRRVGDRDVQKNSVRLVGDYDAVRKILRRRAESQAIDNIARHPPVGHQLPVRLHSLLGEEPTLIGVGVV
jgi:hypothetical protein